MRIDPAALRYDDAGLLPVVVQDVASGAVLMVAWADRDAVERTLESGEGWFWSRSRQRPWKKGESSGNVLSVVEVRADCDGDTLLYRADPAGPACHRDTRTCFDRPPGVTAATDPAAGRTSGDTVAPRLELGWLWEVLAERRAALESGGDAGSYTARLLAAGVDRVARKVGEEATETVIAALRAADEAAAAAAGGEAEGAGGDVGGAPGPSAAPGAGEAAAAPARAALVAETGDLLYHLLVLLMAAGATPGEVAAELRRRHAAPRRPAAPKPEDAP